MQRRAQTIAGRGVPGSGGGDARHGGCHICTRVGCGRDSTLSAGQELQAGQDLISAGGQYTLVMQTDGNLVAYGNGCVIWASNTTGTGSHDYLAMQGDGNLVILPGRANQSGPATPPGRQR